MKTGPSRRFRLSVSKPRRKASRDVFDNDPAKDSGMDERCDVRA